MDWLGDLLGLNKGKATISAADQNKALLSDLSSQITGMIDTGSSKQQGYLNTSNDLASLGPNAKGIMGDIYGLNGADGTARARDAFTTGPGFQFALDTGINALERRGAARGNLQSGNTDLGTLDYANGLASQEWNNWVNGVTGGIDRNISTLGDLASQVGGDTASRISLAGDIGSGTMAANNQTAAGKEAGQGSLWDLLGNVAGVAGSVAGLNFGKGTGAAASMGSAAKAAAPRLGYGGGWSF